MNTQKAIKENYPLLTTSEGRMCIECQAFLPWSNFHKQSSAPNGHKPRCKPCHNQKMNKNSKTILAEEYKVHPLIIDFVIHRKHLTRNKT